MDMTKLTAIVGVLIALSIASERLVEIIKGLFPKLTGKKRYGERGRSTVCGKSGASGRCWDSDRVVGKLRYPSRSASDQKLVGDHCPWSLGQWWLGLLERSPFLRPSGEGSQGSGSAGSKRKRRSYGAEREPKFSSAGGDSLEMNEAL